MEYWKVAAKVLMGWGAGVGAGGSWDVFYRTGGPGVG